MKLYRITDDATKSQEKMAIASRREMSRQQKRQQSQPKGKQIGYPTLDTGDKQLMAMGGGTSYDTYMGV